MRSWLQVVHSGSRNRETLPQRYPPSTSSKSAVSPTRARVERHSKSPGIVQPTPSLFHSFPIPPCAPYNRNYSNHAYNTNPPNSGNLHMRNVANVSTSSLLHGGRPLPTPPPNQAARGSTGTGGKVVNVGGNHNSE
ncbi:hypothetical protein BDN71DRAFT_1246055 [Pleurotus eryngii]|uniref:Uncharacterized protein n=1 Tax=Pleurotus eryngii TaxID=5323 RepID=A0A9P6DE04_PLEER|nr:hypothetical protein BDN71DRAFT_1246055 [Pleurotus eryngii]